MAELPPESPAGAVVQNQIAILESWSQTHGSIYRFPWLTSATCQTLIQKAEFVAGREGWSTTRHEHYATTDVPASRMPGIDRHLRTPLYQELFPFIGARYGVDPKKLYFDDVFVVRYAPQEQPGLEMHQDGGFFTFTVLLNSPDAFEGGGVHIEALNQTLEARQGECMVHGARHRHQGIPITQGVRYILVGFIDLKDSPEKVIRDTLLLHS